MNYMTSHDILARLAELGITTKADGGEIVLRGKVNSLPDELCETIRFYKAKVLDYLNTRDNPEQQKYFDWTYGLGYSGPSIKSYPLGECSSGKDFCAGKWNHAPLTENGIFVLCEPCIRWNGKLTKYKLWR